MRNKNDIDKAFKTIVLIYFMLSPIFDMFFLYSRATTLLRIGVLLVFVALTLIRHKDARKTFKFLLAYYLAMSAYLIASYFHAQEFTSLVPGNFDYSVVSEAATLLKLCVPFTIVFVLKYQSITKKEYFKVLNVWIIIIAGSIVFSNLVGYSLSSYTDAITRYSIFDWWQDLSVNVTATKGFFVYANQVAIVLLLLLVGSFYETLFEDKKYGFLTVLCMISMWMLGTRVSTYGGVMALIFMIFLYVVHSFYSKRRIEAVIIIPTIVASVWLVMIPFTPCNDRMIEIDNAKRGDIVDEVEDYGNANFSQNNSVVSIDEDLDYINANINKATIGEQFYLDFYSYKYDMAFWKDLIEYQNDHYVDYRRLEVMIIDRIWQIDDRWSDCLLGLSNSRIQNVTNIERDFVLHYYAFGAIGSILTLAYYIVAFYYVIKALIKDISFINLTIAFGFGLFVLASFMTGNSLNFLATIIPLAFFVNQCGKYKDC